MTAKDCLDYVVKEVHTTIVATVDDEGLPVTAAIDMMDTDGDSLYYRPERITYYWQRRFKRLLE